MSSSTKCHVKPSLFVIQCRLQYSKCGSKTVSVGHTKQNFSAVRTLHALPWFIDQLFFNLYLCRGDSLKLYHVTQKGGWPICLTMLSMAKCEIVTLLSKLTLLLGPTFWALQKFINKMAWNMTLKTQLLCEFFLFALGRSQSTSLKQEQQCILTQTL